MLCAAPAAQAQQKGQTTKKTSVTSSKKRQTTTAKKSSAKKAPAKKAATAQKTAPAETTEQMKKRQQATQQEIKRTQEDIRKNDINVKQGLADLGRIAADMEVTKKQVGTLAAQVRDLDTKISDLDSKIASGEKELARLRENYLEAVKKIRAKKGSSSALAFIFSSDNFNQAMRRMRYLKQFGSWREAQSAEISEKVAQLKKQNELLAQAKESKGKALRQQQEAEQKLARQHARQDAIVADLKRNGEALRSHLAQKQSEANALRSSIAAAIAAEQKKAEEARRAEEARLRAERDAKAEAAAKAAAEAERKAKEEAAAAATAQNTSKPKKEDTKKTPAKEPKKETKKETKKEPKKETKKETKKEPSKENKNYAEARGRKPRSEAAAPAKSQQPTGNFEAARGSLPKPVSGAFRVTSAFGRHPLPDLPDVMYDNPGIDAEVSAGASALAVFPGRVTGVYKIPGYNTVVIVNHGNYYTVYGNLSGASVKVDDNIKQGQALGRVAEDEDDGRPTIHFEVWKNRDKLNPLDWIR